MDAGVSPNVLINPFLGVVDNQGHPWHSVKARVNNRLIQIR
jgi:hypothetical protein